MLSAARARSAVRSRSAAARVSPGRAALSAFGAARAVDVIPVQLIQRVFVDVL